MHRMKVCANGAGDEGVIFSESTQSSDCCHCCVALTNSLILLNIKFRHRHSSLLKWSNHSENPTILYIFWPYHKSWNFCGTPRDTHSLTVCHGKPVGNLCSKAFCILHKKGQKFEKVRRLLTGHIPYFLHSKYTNGKEPKFINYL